MNEMHEDAVAYALFALDAAELTEFEAHLATCESCQREVAAFSETAAALSVLTQATPPPKLRTRVLATIPQLPQLAAEDDGTDRLRALAPASSRTSKVTGGPSGSALAGRLDTLPLKELELRRQRRRIQVLRGLVAALVIVAVGLGGVIYAVVQQHQAEVAAKPAFEEQLLRAEDVQVVVEPTLQGGGRCTFVVSRKLNRALYLGTNMPDPGPGRHYQLWTVVGTSSNADPYLDNPVPNVRPWRQFFRGDVAGADALAVSIERDGSTPEVPTSDQIVVLAQLPT